MYAYSDPGGGGDDIQFNNTKYYARSASPSSDVHFGPVKIFVSQTGQTSKINWGLQCVDIDSTGTTTLSDTTSYTNLNAGTSLNVRTYVYFGSDCYDPDYVDTWDYNILEMP